MGSEHFSDEDESQEPVHCQERVDRLVRRAAERGYAPAQAKLGLRCAPDRLLWVERSAAQGWRDGQYELARCLWNGQDCLADQPRAVALFRAAAEAATPWPSWTTARRGLPRASGSDTAGGPEQPASCLGIGTVRLRAS